MRWRQEPQWPPSQWAPRPPCALFSYDFAESTVLTSQCSVLPVLPEQRSRFIKVTRPVGFSDMCSFGKSSLLKRKRSVMNRLMSWSKKEWTRNWTVQLLERCPGRAWLHSRDKPRLNHSILDSGWKRQQRKCARWAWNSNWYHIGRIHEATSAGKEDGQAQCPLWAISMLLRQEWRGEIGKNSGRREALFEMLRVTQASWKSCRYASSASFTAELPTIVQYIILSCVQSLW